MDITKLQEHFEEHNKKSNLVNKILKLLYKLSLEDLYKILAIVKAAANK